LLYAGAATVANAIAVILAGNKCGDASLRQQAAVTRRQKLVSKRIAGDSAPIEDVNPRRG
jgi:hypothetical protein